MSFIPVIVYAANAYRAAATAEEASAALTTLGYSVSAETAYWGASIYGVHYFLSETQEGSMAPKTGGARKKLKTSMSSASGTRLKSKSTSRTSASKSRAASRNRRTGGVIGRFQPSSGVTELKFIDTAYNITPIVAATVFNQSPNIIVQGTGPSQRVGLGVTIKSVQLRGTMRYDPGTASRGTDTCYMYLILDKECNGVIPTAFGSDGVFTSDDLDVSHVNIANSFRFTILKKWIFNFNVQSLNPAGTQGYDLSYPIEFYQKVDFPIKWQSINSDGALSSQTRNALWLITGSTDQTPLGTFTMLGNMRLRYNDHC